jgi:hypothetical protein
VDAVVFPAALDQVRTEVLADGGEDLAQRRVVRLLQHPAPVPRHEDQTDVQGG